MTSALEYVYFKIFQIWNCGKKYLIFKRKGPSPDYVPASLEESIQLLDSLEKPPKVKKSKTKENSTIASDIENHILNSAADVNIIQDDTINGQAAGCSYSTKRTTIDNNKKSTLEKVGINQRTSHSSTKLWSFMNLQKPAVYRTNRKFSKMHIPEVFSLRVVWFISYGNKNMFC